MQKRTYACLLVALGWLAAPAEAQTSTPAPIDGAVRQAVKAAHVAGATVAVIKDGNVIYAGGIGKRDLASGLPADEATTYEVGSVTKEFTAAAVLQLCEVGKIRLDVPLATYLPSAPHAKEVTIRQLLTMQSGLPDYIAGENVEALAATPATFDQLIARIAAKPLDFAPGSQFGASSTNYLMLGRVVEVVSGQRWSDYVQQHLFAPAGMTASTTIASEAQVSDMARGYATVNGKNVPSGPLDASWARAAGDVVTTVGDLAKWDAALASGKVVSERDYALMTTPKLLADGLTSDYGMGMYVDIGEGDPRLLAQGDTFGYDATDVAYPKQGLRIIVLTNTENGVVGVSGSTEIADFIYDALVPVSASSSSSATALYAAAVRTMDYVQQPAYVAYTFEGASDKVHIGLQVVSHQVWLAFQHGNVPSTWAVQHRTEDYQSEVIDGVRRLVSGRSLFDPTWFGAYRALRDGMLGYQDAEAAHTSLAVAEPTPTPDPKLSTIASVSAIGTGIYFVQDRGAAACPNGDPGHAVHLRPRHRDPRHQLSDAIIDLRSMRFCSIRFQWNELWLTGIVEQHYADVGGYWMETGGAIEGKVSLLGIQANHFVWQYRLSNMTFPQLIAPSTFIPNPAQ